MAGVVPLDPSTLTAHPESVEQTMRNLTAVAGEFDTPLDDRDTSILYLSTESHTIEHDNTATVYATDLPKSLPVEIELHLNTAKRQIATTSGSIECQGFEIPYTMSSSEEYVYINAVFNFEGVTSATEGLEKIRELLQEKFRATKHKAPSYDADFLNPEVDPKLEDYVIDARLYNPSPEEYK